jgi:CheY-like chemotaxis protein
MSPSHVALIIEDDPIWAKLLCDLVLSLGHDFILATTLQDARAAIEAGGYCYVLLDMEIPARAGMDPNVACGETALELLRKKHPHRRDDGRHVLQILVATGYSNDGEFSSRLHQMDADAFISKSSFARAGYVSDQIRSALTRAGRADHAACGPLVAPEARPAIALAASTSRLVRIVLDGQRSGRRVGLLVNGARLRVPDQVFLFFLRLVLEALRAPGSWHTLADLGFASNVVLPSRLRAAFAPVVPEGLDVLEKTGLDRYRLNPQVVVEHVDWRVLEADADQTVARVAREGARVVRAGD